MELTITRNPDGRPTGRLLTGEDDGAEFSVRVPLRVKTIEQALTWLRPEGVNEHDLRQGDLYFVPSDDPHKICGCDGWNSLRCSRRDGCSSCLAEDESYTGTVHRWTLTSDDEHLLGRHRAERAAVLRKSGHVAFVGRRRVKTHPYAARPRVFARGIIEHREHGTLDLGEQWHEVIPNRASGLLGDGD